MAIVPIALSGMGSVHRHLLTLFMTKAQRLVDEHELQFRVVWIADSTAIRREPEGFDARTLEEFKRNGGRLRDFERGELLASEPNAEDPRLFDSLGDCELLFEATPVDLESGGFGLRVTKAASERGLHVVLANKGPLVKDYASIMSLAKRVGRGVGFSATVCGGLPVVNVGRRDMPLADVKLLRGIFNSTTNFMLEQMRAGRSYRDSLAEAQRRGIAETNPDNDVLGYDSAAKLVILANAVLGIPAGLDDVSIEGIDRLDGLDGNEGEAGIESPEASITRLIASAERAPDGYRLAVAPVRVERDSFLGRCNGWEMGVELETDIYGHQFFKIWEREPLPTAAAMLRDAIHLLSTPSRPD